MYKTGEKSFAKRVHALANLCQGVIGTVYAGEPVDVIVAKFAVAPKPRSFGEVRTFERLLAEFSDRLGVELHRRSEHCRRTHACGFMFRTVLDARLDGRHIADWSAEAWLRRWRTMHDRAFASAHPAPVSDRAKQRILGDPASIGTAEDVSRDIACSVSVLRRRFEEAGDSFRDYKRKSRVLRALELLTTTDWKVEVIAHEVGWRSKKNLYRALDHMVGLTPAEVRSLPQQHAEHLISGVREKLCA